MASVPLTLPQAPPLRLEQRTDIERWPVTATQRWLLRLALAVPYLVLAAVTASKDIVSPVNARIEETGQLIEWGSADLQAFVGQIYPPIPVAIAAALPGGAAALSYVGALFAGILMQALWERLHVRGVRGWLIAVLLFTFGASPAFCYVVTQDLPGFLGLGLLAVALTAFLRFATQGDTEAGFKCGLSLGLAVLCDPAALIYAACLGIAAAPVALNRYRGETHSARASALVIAFPALAAVSAWIFVAWLFTGEAFGWLTADPKVFAFDGGVRHSLWDAIRRTAIGLVASPLFVVTQLMLVRRRLEALLVAVLPLAGSVLGLWLGLRVANGATVVLLGLIATVSVPRRPSLAVSTVLAAAAVAGFALVSLRLALPNGPVKDWLLAVLD
jgi:hypothetical protein